jgi:DNA-binding LacI/PurR family transcriptional regulator
MASDPENDPRVVQFAARFRPPALAIAKAVSEAATAAALAELPYATGAFVNAVRANDFAMYGSALIGLVTETVVAAYSSAAMAFETHALTQHQSETLAAETAAKLQDENEELRELISYQCHKLEMLTRADERSARKIEALEERISCLECELALKTTAEDRESDHPPKTEKHDE